MLLQNPVMSYGMEPRRLVRSAAEVNQMQARGTLYCADTDKCFELYAGLKTDNFMLMQHRKAR